MYFVSDTIRFLQNIDHDGDICLPSHRIIDLGTELDVSTKFAFAALLKVYKYSYLNSDNKLRLLAANVLFAI